MVNIRFRPFLMLLTALCLLCALPSWAALQAQVDRNPVAMNEPFTLTLKSDAGGGDPDLTALKRNFEVLGQSKSSSLQIINGSISRSTQWQISLSPKQPGQVQIPAISVGSASSPPISLTVMPQTQASVDEQNRNLFLEVSATPRTVHVQQQIVFTVRLYSALNLGNGSQLSEPAFPGMDAVVKPLGDEPPFEMQRNGQTYTVVERRYAVFPQKSGQFSSTPVVFDGTVIEANQGGNGPFMFNPFNQTSRPMRLRSKPLSFDVKPLPPEIDSGQWLPASSVQLSEQWSSNPPVFSVGEPITRTLTLTAAGLTASQLPALNSGAIDGLKVYPDQPTLKDTPDESGMVGTRTEKIAYIPIRTGSVTLPAIDIKWWNIAANKMELVQLPARTVKVLPGSATPATPPVTAGAATLDTPAQSAPAAQPSNTAAHVAEGWPWLALLLGVGWLFTLLAWWWRRKTTPPPALKTAQPDSLVALEKQIKQACQVNDAAQAKTQLLAWAKARWPVQPPTSLTAIARRCDPALAEALIGLDRSLYAALQSSWRGETLWQQFSRYKPAADQTETGKPAPLAPLYKSTEK